MKKAIFFSSLVLLITLTACTQSKYSRYDGKTWEQLSGSGKLINLSPTVGPFNTIEVNHLNAKIIVETGATAYSMQVSIDDNLAEFFRSKQEGNTLQLSFDLSGGKYSRWLSSNNTVITIKAPSIEKLINKGNTNIEVMLKNQSFFTLNTEGNPDITLSGKLNTFNLQTTGNSDINAGALFTQTASIRSTGNADILVNAKEIIEQETEGNNEINNLFGKTILQIEKETAMPVPEDAFITIKLKNNSMFPFKATIITYRPDEDGNGTTGVTLMPMGVKKYRVPVGTKFYLATDAQVNTVMSGAKISDQPPFLIVMKEDDGKTFNLKN